MRRYNRSIDVPENINELELLKQFSKSLARKDGIFRYADLHKWLLAKFGYRDVVPVLKVIAHPDVEYRGDVNYKTPY